MRDKLIHLVNQHENKAKKVLFEQDNSWKQQRFYHLGRAHSYRKAIKLLRDHKLESKRLKHLGKERLKK